MASAADPTPLFLAHAAGLSEIYVALVTILPAGVTLGRFEREADAREPFETSLRKKRAIAPDVFIEVSDSGHALLAFIELDMGTMSHRRLKQKAAGYAEYAKAEAWRERHRFCPALLFLTTTEKRARSFLAAMEREWAATRCCSRVAVTWRGESSAARPSRAGCSTSRTRRPSTCRRRCARRAALTTKSASGARPGAARKTPRGSGFGETPRPCATTFNGGATVTGHRAARRARRDRACDHDRLQGGAGGCRAPGTDGAWRDVRRPA